MAFDVSFNALQCVYFVNWLLQKSIVIHMCFIICCVLELNVFVDPVEWVVPSLSLFHTLIKGLITTLPSSPHCFVF